MKDSPVVQLDATVIMARVRAVLDPEGAGTMNAAQQALFGTTAEQIVAFGTEKDNPMVSLADHIGNFWRNWLLMILNTGSYRPSTVCKLLRALHPWHPISKRMLTLNLRMLERDGLVFRKVMSTEISHVEYGLTPLGQGLANELRCVIAWIGHHAGEVAKARAAFDATPD